MSHELEIVNGKVAMAWAGETPWHGLGKEIPYDLTPEQILEAASLDWEVNKIPVTYDLNGIQNPTGRSALIRSSDSKMLDIVTDDWEPVQNAEAFGFFHEWVMAGDMNMHTAGSLHGGRMVWALAKVNDDFTLENGDHVEGYLLFSNPHQYGRSIDVRFTPIRVVCNNTLTLALGKSKAQTAVRLNHRKKFNPELVKTLLGAAHHKMSDYKKAAEFLSKKRYNEESIHEYINKLFPIAGENKKEKEYSRPGQKVYDLLDTQPGADMAPGSWWNAFNAVTFAQDHVLGNSQDNRLSNAWYGGGADRKVLALNTAMEYANVA